MAAIFNDKEYIIGTADYRNNFWNAMRRNPYDQAVLDQAEETPVAERQIPLQDTMQMEKIIEREGVFRKLATVAKFYGGASRIFAHDCGEVAAWVPEGGEIPLQDAMEDFSTIPVDSHKLAVFVKMDEEFVHDASFGMEDYLLTRFAKNFAKAEDYGFLNGTGDGMPTGLLDSEKGAEIGANTAGLSFDDLIKLYSSVKPEYRKNGAWLMNDDTALVLRTLKDENGAYIWNSEKDTLLGKPVIIAEGMPNAEAGKLPVLFGDFRYYWVVRRSPVRVRTLKEKFVRYSQIGYLAIEYMDGKLVRRDAVKALKITA